MTSLRVTSCAYLRCKNDSYQNPFAEDAVEESAMPRVYWCGKTLKAFGPDDGEVQLPVCQPGRTCFQDSIQKSPQL